MFNIEILGKPSRVECQKPGYKMLQGNIVIGNFSEHLDVPIGYWSADDYFRQWLEAIKNIVEDKENQNATLITQMFDPLKKEFGYIIEHWPMHRVGSNVYLQNKYETAESLAMPFELNNLYKSLDYKKEKTAIESGVSEWCIDISDLQEFANRLESR